MERKHEYQTKSRQMILDYLIRIKDRAVHVSDIIQYMDQEECSVNKTTVYRYLDKLVAEKTLMKYVADKGEKAGYQYVETAIQMSEASTSAMLRMWKGHPSGL